MDSGPEVPFFFGAVSKFSYLLTWRRKWESWTEMEKAHDRVVYRGIVGGTMFLEERERTLFATT